MGFSTLLTFYKTDLFGILHTLKDEPESLNGVVNPKISNSYQSIWMDILLLTIFLSVILASLFILLFIKDREKSQRSSMEQDSLLPLAEEHSVPASKSIHKKDPPLKG